MHLSALEKAEILVEALPYIKTFYGRTVVIKYGGAAMVECDLKQKIMQDIVLMKYVGMNPIVVHGGGPEITQMLERLGIKSQFINGLRVTDRATMEVVEMVLGGKVNKEIVAGINANGGQAIGISGKDGNLIKARPVGDTAQMGYVGEVVQINPGVIETLIANNYIPVIAPIGIDENHDSYNINADLVASAIAAAMQADKLVLLTDVPGLLKDPQDAGSLISVLRLSDVDQYVKDGIISGGMLPKVECCLEAVRAGRVRDVPEAFVSRPSVLRLPKALALLEALVDEATPPDVKRAK